MVGDSELIAKQVQRHLQGQAPRDAPAAPRRRWTALRDFERWSIRTVPRAQNADADALVNAALDQGAAAASGLTDRAAEYLPRQCSGWAERAIAIICAFESSSSSVLVTQ